MTDEKTANRSANLSIMRISAAVAVILLHTCSTLSENRDIFAMSDFQADVFSTLANLMRWAVPVFFMITGSLLLDPSKEITYKKGIFRYVRRIILALLVFGIPFAMMKLVMENRGFSISMIWKSVLCVLENQSLSHLWYLYDLIGIYLIMPLIKGFTDKADKNEIRTALIILVIFDFLIPAVSLVSGLNIAFHIPLQYSLFYLIAGLYLRLYKEEYPSRRLLILTLLCAVIITVLTLSRISVWMAGAYDSPLTAVYSLCICCLFLKMNESFNDMQASTLWQLDRLCFAVYLIHPVFIQFTYRFLKITPLVSDSAWLLLTLVFWIIFTIITFSAAWILRKIPVLRKYIL